jgi:hypothetical protein
MKPNRMGQYWYQYLLLRNLETTVGTVPTYPSELSGSRYGRCRKNLAFCGVSFFLWWRERTCPRHDQEFQTSQGLVSSCRDVVDHKKEIG